MKILMISGTLPPYKCGVGDYTYHLAKHLSNHGIEIDVFTSCKAFAFKECNVYNSVKSWNRLEVLKSIVTICKKNHYDIIHIQFPTAMYGKRIIACMITPLLKIMKFKVILTIHEYTGGSFRYKVELWPSLMCADKIIIVEQKFKKEIIKLPISLSKIAFINIGANVSKSACNPTVLEMIRSEIIGGNKDYKIVSTFGFISPGKLTKEILYALYHLKKNGELKTKLMIVGDLCEDNIYQREILQFIKDNDMENDVYITGFLPMDEVGDYLAASDYACVLFKDGVSVRNGSFLACVQEGIPVITTKPNKTLQGFDNVVYLENVETELWKQMIKFQGTNIVKKYTNYENKQLDWNNIAERHIKLYKVSCRKRKRRIWKKDH